MKLLKISFFIGLGVLLLCPNLSAFAAKLSSRDPTYAEILFAYQSQHRHDLAKLRALQKKLKSAAYLPDLSVSYDHGFDHSVSLSTDDNISISDGVITIGPDESGYDYADDLNRTLTFKAVWCLPDLIYQRDQVLITREMRYLSLVAAQRENDLYKIVEQRRQLFAAYHAPSAAGKKFEIASRHALLTQRLDALTGGVFADRWQQLSSFSKH